MGSLYVVGLLSFLTGCLLVPLGESWTIDTPGFVTAVEGSCVEVPCHTEAHQRVIWYRYHGVNYPVVYNGQQPTSVEYQFQGRTSVPGDATKGDCTLRIDNVRREDNQVQVYVWINPDESQSQKFYHQVVTINVVGKRAPVIWIQGEQEEGAPLQASCSVQHSCPSSPPTLHWNTRLEHSPLQSTTARSGALWVVTSRIQGRALHQLHNAVIRCTALFNSVPTESQPITLNVLYAPVSVNLTSEQVTEGHSVNMKCVADSNPKPDRYVWMRRQGGTDIQINSTNKDRLSFSKIARNTAFSCIAQNNFGEKQSAWLYLDVNFAPDILSDSACSLTNGHLSCVCQAEAQPSASLAWTIDGEDTLPASFTSVTTYRRNVVSTQIAGPVEREPNVSCSALNPVGRATRQIPVLRGTTLALRGTVIAVVCGCALLCTVVGLLAFKISHSKRKSQRSLCASPAGTDIPLRQSVTYQNQRYRAAPRSAISRSETEAIRSSIYVNEFVPQKPRVAPRCKKNTTRDMQSDNDDVYQNI